MDDEKYMKAAIAQAEFAAKMGEVPVGAIIVSDGDIISTGFNKRERLNNSLEFNIICHTRAMRYVCWSDNKFQD